MTVAIHQGRRLYLCCSAAFLENIIHDLHTSISWRPIFILYFADESNQVACTNRELQDIIKRLTDSLNTYGGKTSTDKDWSHWLLSMAKHCREKEIHLHCIQKVAKDTNSGKAGIKCQLNISGNFCDLKDLTSFCTYVMFVGMDHKNRTLCVCACV